MGPAAAIASGGERSRIHLGLSVLAGREEGGLLWLFDEIDAGLGMDHAPPVAALLRELALHNQVICITHLPTMAVYGDRHLMVTKKVRRGRTTLETSELAGEARVAEIARLLGGDRGRNGDWESQQEYARELLREPGRRQQASSGRA
jgi:DNA repair protein RecN (Recombination protein N)